MKTIKGFTLIELLVAIVIIGILATISISSFSGHQSRAYNSTIESVVSHISKQTILDLIELEDFNGYDELRPHDVIYRAGIVRTKKGKLDYIASKKDFIYIGTLADSESDGLWSVIDTAYAYHNKRIENDKFFISGSPKAVSNFENVVNKVQFVQSISGNPASNDVSIMGADYTYAINVWDNTSGSRENIDGYAAGEGDFAHICIDADEVGAKCNGGYKISNIGNTVLFPLGSLAMNCEPPYNTGTWGCNWQGAINICNDLDNEGHNDWRLPTTTELNTIKINYTTIYGLYKSCTFGGWHWSSTSYSSIQAYMLNFACQEGKPYAKSSVFRVICVR